MCLELTLDFSLAGLIYSCPPHLINLIFLKQTSHPFPPHLGFCSSGVVEHRKVDFADLNQDVHWGLIAPHQLKCLNLAENVSGMCKMGTLVKCEAILTEMFSHRKILGHEKFVSESIWTSSLEKLHTVPNRSVSHHWHQRKDKLLNFPWNELRLLSVFCEL